jgi:hypothetical protein
MDQRQSVQMGQVMRSAILITGIAALLLATGTVHARNANMCIEQW